MECYVVSPHRAYRNALKNGYRSGLEHKLSLYLKSLKYKFAYETIKIEWQDLAYRTYTPDFILKNGIIPNSATCPDILAIRIGPPN